MSDLIPAATVILGRDAADGGAVEVLMLRRDSRLAFAGGMWVFPGGRLDDEDFAGDLDDLDTAERRAAARESLEECGLEVPWDGLERWSHWIPPDHGQAHRFSTAFFVAAAPDGDVVIDDGEIRAHRWISPVAAIELHRKGEVELSPPTYVTLVQLARADSLARLLDLARTEPPERFATRIGFDGDTMIALYDGDSGYESSDATLPGARHRLTMSGTDWTYVRD